MCILRMQLNLPSPLSPLRVCLLQMGGEDAAQFQYYQSLTPHQQAMYEQAAYQSMGQAQYGEMQPQVGHIAQVQYGDMQPQMGQISQAQYGDMQPQMGQIPQVQYGEMQPQQFHYQQQQQQQYFGGAMQAQVGTTCTGGVWFGRLLVLWLALIIQISDVCHASYAASIVRLQWCNPYRPP